MMLGRRVPSSFRSSNSLIKGLGWWASSLSPVRLASTSTEDWTTIRREAFQVIQSAAKPISTRDVHSQLVARCPEEEKTKLTMTHLKSKILKSMKEAHHIRMKAVLVEGKKRPEFGWVVSKLPSFAAKDKPVAS